MDLGTQTALVANLLGALAAALTIGGIAYKRPASVIGAIAKRTGIEVYLSPEAAIEDLTEEELSLHIEDPRLLLDRLEELERGHDEGKELFTAAGRVLIDREAVAGADRDEQLEHVAELANRLELPPETWCVDPIKKITRLEDDPRRAYVWLLGDRATGDDVSSLTHRFEEAFAEAHGREPSALHLIVRDVGAIEEIPEEAIEEIIKPWLRDRDRAAEIAERRADVEEVS